MAERTHGKLSKWNDDRGFGFITPAGGGADLFVHVSAFPGDGERPRLEELISYEIEKAADGKLRAVRVMRPASRERPRAAKRPREAEASRPRYPAFAAVLVVAAVAAFAYARFWRAPAGVHEEMLLQEPTRNFACDGRTKCSQMTSCAEAEFFLAHCPNTQMDGNGDGEPCEQQWCN